MYMQPIILGCWIQPQPIEEIHFCTSVEDTEASASDGGIRNTAVSHQHIGKSVLQKKRQICQISRI